MQHVLDVLFLSINLEFYGIPSNDQSIVAQPSAEFPQVTYNDKSAPALVRMVFNVAAAVVAVCSFAFSGLATKPTQPERSVHP